MQRVMSASDDLTTRQGVHSVLRKSSSGDTPMLDVRMTKCLQSIRSTAAQAQQEASSRAESDAIAVVARDLVNGCLPTAPVDSQVEDDVRTSSSDSEEHESSSLDREVRRLQVLKSYLGVLDADHGIKFERLTALASRIFRAPMALVTIADLDKQYWISSRGIDYKSTLQSPFCSHAVLADCDMLVVRDALTDPRFAKDPRVTGYPFVRYYAGAPLICPEGHRLGTLCVMDTKPRTEPTSLEDKQSLMELAAMAMENLVELRTSKQHAMKDPAQQIACTAHDLLTPLTGIALSLSLLKEDEGLQRKLTEPQRDMIETAANCSSVMNSICHKTMNFFRDQGRPKSVSRSTITKNNLARKIGPTKVKTSDLVKNLHSVMEPFPKQVPIVVSVDPNVPAEFVSDDMKLFRAATNYLTNACAKTESGSIHFRIFTRTNAEGGEEIVFECEDTGPGVDVAKYAYLFQPVRDEADPLLVSSATPLAKNIPAGVLREGVQNTGLGLYSVATQIDSIGGKYGFRPRGIAEGEAGDIKGSGSIFWFCIPLVLPSSTRPAVRLPGQQPATSALNQEFGGKTAEDGQRSRMLGAGLKGSGSSGTLKRLESEDALEVYANSSRSATPISRANKRFHPDVTPDRQSRALVIEDSLVVRKSLSRVLAKLGFEVTQAVNGMEGLKELKASLFDMVLCDFLMPVMDGLDCIQQYRQWEKVNRPYFKQYIIGISAHASDTDVDQGYKIGMNEFRSKPLTYASLTELKNGKKFNQTRMELDNLGHEIECLKRRKVELEMDTNISAPPNQRVCLVIESAAVVSKLAKMASEKIGWKIVSVMDPDSALGLLKIRNWDAVLVDDELCCSRCISIFREWETKHRVNRQRNVILMSASYVAPESNDQSFQVPTGFDGALGKPIQLNALNTFLKEARTSWEIVTR